MANIIKFGGGAGGYNKLKIVVPDGATEVKCYRLDESDGSIVRELSDGATLRAGWILKTFATPDTIESNVYVVPELDVNFVVTAGDRLWEGIVELVEKGIVENVYEVGDTISFTCTDDWTGYATIMGFNHDEKSDGTGYAAVTFGTEYLYHTTYSMWNTSGAQGSYPNMKMAYEHLPAILETLPDTIKDNIKTVVKSSEYFNGNCVDTDANLWLFSSAEIGLHTGAEDSTLYPYYRDGGSLIKNIYGVSASNWLTRSAVYSYNSSTIYYSSWLGVTATGTLTMIGCGTSAGVNFGFCL